MLTHLSIDHGDARTATLRLDAWVPPRRIAVGWRPEQATSPAIQAFVSTARKVTRALQGQIHKASASGNAGRSRRRARPSPPRFQAPASAPASGGSARP